MLEHKNVSITLSTYTKLANIGCEAKFPWKFIKEDDEVRIRNIEKMGTIMDAFSD